MNIVLAVTIIVALGCAAFVRIVCIYNIQNGTNKLSKSTDIATGLMFLTSALFFVEFLFSPFNIIL